MGRVAPPAAAFAQTWRNRGSAAPKQTRLTSAGPKASVCRWVSEGRAGRTWGDFLRRFPGGDDLPQPSGGRGKRSVLFSQLPCLLGNCVSIHCRLSTVHRLVGEDYTESHCCDRIYFLICNAFIVIFVNIKALVIYLSIHLHRDGSCCGWDTYTQHKPKSDERILMKRIS